MKPAHHDGTNSPDASSNLAGIAATPGLSAHVPFNGTGYRETSAGMLRQQELARLRPLTALTLPSRVTNALLRSGVNSVGQLISRSREDLMTEITGIGAGSLKVIEAALARKNLTLAPTEKPSPAFSRMSTSRGLNSAKNNRHIKNHNAWVNPTHANPSLIATPYSADGMQRCSCLCSPSKCPADHERGTSP